MTTLQQVIKQKRDEFEKEFGNYWRDKKGLILEVVEPEKMIKEVSSHNLQTVGAILEAVKDWVENIELNLDANSRNHAYFAKGFNSLRDELSSLLSSTLQEIKNQK